jgi:hypothetical protein
MLVVCVLYLVSRSLLHDNEFQNMAFLLTLFPLCSAFTLVYFVSSAALLTLSSFSVNLFMLDEIDEFLVAV